MKSAKFITTNRKYTIRQPFSSFIYMALIGRIISRNISVEMPPAKHQTLVYRYPCCLFLCWIVFGFRYQPTGEEAVSHVYMNPG